MKGAGIGLISLLIVGAITFWIMFGGKEQGGGYVRSEMEARENATNQINAIGGKTSEGKPVTETLVVTVEPARGVIIINSLDPDSPFVSKYGIRVGDQVLELGPLSVKSSVSNEADAKAYLSQAFTRSDTIVVDRNGTKLTLPDQRQADPTPAANAAATATPASPAPQQPKKVGPMGAARDLVNQIETH